MNKLREIIENRILEDACFNIIGDYESCSFRWKSSQRSHDHYVSINQVAVYLNIKPTVEVPLLTIQSDLSVWFSDKISSEKQKQFVDYFRGVGIDLKH